MANNKRAPFSKRSLQTESPEESDTELIRISDQLVLSDTPDDGQGPAIGVSSGRTVRPVAASFMFPSTMASLSHVPERWTDNGEEFLVPDPDHPFATWAPAVDSSSSLIPPIHLRGTRSNFRTAASMSTSSSAEPPLTGEWRYTLPPNPVVSTPQAAIAPVVAANVPILPTAVDGVAPGDFGDLFRGPTNGTTIVPAYLELSFPSVALPSRRYARELYAQLAVGQSICVMGFNSDVISWESMMGPVVIYLVVHKLLDGSVDAVRAFVATADLAARVSSAMDHLSPRGGRN